MIKRYTGELPSQPLRHGAHISAATMSEYVLFEVLGQQAPDSWRPLEAHVAECTLCRAELDGLRQTVRAVYEAALPDTPPPPPPNLAFLMKDPAPRRSMAEKLAKRLPSAFSAAITLPFPTPLALALRAATPARSTRHFMPMQYERPRGSEDEPAITLNGQRTSGELATIHVCVEWIDRDPFDQAGTHVLGEGPAKVVEHVTDESGNVTFEDIPLEHIDDWRFMIHPPPSASHP